MASDASTQKYEALLEAIRAKCQQNHWFGPDESSPLRRKRVSMDNPNRFGFVFPPATEEQLRMTETLLNLPLPPLLRALLNKVSQFNAVAKYCFAFSPFNIV